MSFASNETLANVGVSLGGPENTVLTSEVFTETSGTYTATHESNSDGRYTATLETAKDAAGNDGADGRSDEVTVHTGDAEIVVASPIEGATRGGSELPVDLNVSVTESVDSQSYSLDGGTNQSFVHNATLSRSELSAGNQSVTVYAEDDAGNVGADTVGFSVDTAEPHISELAFVVTEKPGQNVSISFPSNETLESVSVDLDGPENATLTETDFEYMRTIGDYIATHDGNSSGTYVATLTTAEEAAGNDGASGQSDSVSVTSVDDSGTSYDSSDGGTEYDSTSDSTTDGSTTSQETGDDSTGDSSEQTVESDSRKTDTQSEGAQSSVSSVEESSGVSAGGRVLVFLAVGGTALLAVARRVLPLTESDG